MQAVTRAPVSSGCRSGISRPYSFARSQHSCRGELLHTAALKRSDGPVIKASSGQQQHDARQMVAKSLAAAVLTATLLLSPATSQAASDTAAVGKCLLSNCQVQLAKCLGDPDCLANLICLQQCNGRVDEKECQIRCGDLHDDAAIATFNECAVSEKKCVPQLTTENAYPVPPAAAMVPTFDPSQFTGRWYITAGYNKLFDTFDCQEHFFTNPEPGKIFGKINWRIPEDNGDFIERSTVQRFVQDPENPAVMVNSGNQYLHYEDTWYVLAFKPDEYAVIYYKGNNDAWKGYGGATVYTRAASLPKEYIPDIKVASEAVGLKWEDWTLTNNECAAHPKTGNAVLNWFKSFEKSVERTLADDLQSFGRGFSLLQKDLEQEFTAEEKVIERELAEAAKALSDLESTYEKTFLQSLKFW